MNYAELMTKIGSGQPLTAEEYADLQKVARPAERLNAIQAEKAALEAKLTETTAKVTTLEVAKTEAVQNLQAQVDAQLQALGGKVETLSTENTKLKETHTQLSQKMKFVEIAQKNDNGFEFTNPSYLQYEAQQRGVDISNKDAVKAFLETMKTEAPQLCRVPVKSGAGTGTGTTDISTSATSSKKPSDMSMAEKAAFIKQNGEAKYKELKG